MSTPTRRRVPVRALPRVAKSWSFLYVERAHVERANNGVLVRDEHGSVQVPVATLTTLLLGPGTRITQEAVKVSADCGLGLVWVGEGGVRCYGAGLGETNSAKNLLHQAATWADEEERLRVVRRMYEHRFDEGLPASLTLEQIRGREGVRVRTAYAQASKATGVPWMGRDYKPKSWRHADPVNQALSTANSCLYGICHAAIVATGFSPGIGFVHTGKLLSFVYDIADLYKVDLTIPIAFRAVEQGGRQGLSGRVRRACRDMFRHHRLLARIVPDIQMCLGLRPIPARVYELDLEPDADSARGLVLWDSVAPVPAGKNYAGGNES